MGIRRDDIAAIRANKEYSVDTCVQASITLKALGISGSITSLNAKNETFVSVKYNSHESLGEINLILKGQHYDLLYKKVQNQSERVSEVSTIYDG